MLSFWDLTWWLYFTDELLWFWTWLGMMQDTLGNWTIWADGPGSNLFKVILVEHPELGDFSHIYPWNVEGEASICDWWLSCSWAMSNLRDDGSYSYLPDKSGAIRRWFAWRDGSFACDAHLGNIMLLLICFSGNATAFPYQTIWAFCLSTIVKWGQMEFVIYIHFLDINLMQPRIKGKS